jgi:ABC-type uncharacterized transport system auxiliary subunit
VLTRRIGQAALVVLIGASVASCGGSRPVKYYALDATPSPATSSAPQIPVTLLVARISASDLYREDRLVYGSGTVQYGTYEYQRWSEPPAGMLQDIVVKTLRASGNYRSVARISSNLRGDYIVRGQLYALDEVESPGLSARFSFQLELYDPKASTMIWSSSYTHDEPVEGKTVANVVEALDRNVKAGVSQLAGEMSQYLASHPRQTASPE